MDSSVELIERQPKKGATHSQISVASSYPPITSLGKPVEKRYYTWLDACMIATSFSCLFIGVLAVVDVSFAGRLGQKNQLILVGFLLSLMAACTKKQIQLFLLTLETRFGDSTLQNYDSILRYSVLDPNVNVFLKAAIIFVFALPLGLSASYKTFVSGMTALPIDPTFLAFGPVGPPGLVEGVLSMAMNATLPLLIATNISYRSEPLFRFSTDNPAKTGSFGFNAQILSKNTTALIDAPLGDELARLKNTIKADEILEFSTYVNATICTLNSTKYSPERANPDYWLIFYQSGLQAPTNATYGTGLNFAASTRNNDYSFIFLSLWNTSKGETFESEAVGFDIFRGQCNATWQLNREGTTTLQSASNCTSTPQYSHPCLEEIPNGFNATHLNSTDALQTPLTCNQRGVSHIAVWPLYDLLWLQPVSPVWVAAVASMAWAELSYTNGPASPNETAQIPMLQYEAPVRMTRKIQTLHRDRWSLYLVLAVQPMLLLASFLGRRMLYSAPVSNGFGLIALLAGVSRDSLDVLRGAAFSGTLTKPVRIRISTNVQDGGWLRSREANIEYELDSQGRHDRIEKGRIYG